MDHLYSTNASIDQDVFRNIVYLPPTANVFDDLMPKHALKKGTQIAIDAEARVKADPTIIPQDFHYATAISYPFFNKPCRHSRYSNGEYSVWYGSLEHRTTIYETVYHMFRSTLAIDGVNEIVRQKRAIYTVYSKAILIDLRGKEKEYPGLIADHYDFTQSIGATLQKQGHPGLLTPSARTQGSNVVIFNPDVLRQPMLAGTLEYELDPNQLVTTIKNPLGKTLMTIAFSDIARS
jgi:hypothetical protein